MKLSIRAGVCGLLVVSILSGAILSGCGSPVEPTPTQQTPAQATPTSLPSQGRDDRVEVVYFHRANRCHSCTTIEEAVRNVIENDFAQQLQSGDLAFQVLNVEDEANSATIERYGAHTSSLFINTVEEGRDHIEEVTKAWLVVNDSEALANLVKGEIQEHLESI